MIYSSALSQIFLDLGINQQSEVLDQYIKDTILIPNQINVNTITLRLLRSNSSLYKEILSKLDSQVLEQKNLNLIFLQLLDSNLNETVLNSLVRTTKNSFLTTLVGSLVYGFIKEINELPEVKEKHFDFQIH